jgi:hypothetical protein
MSSITAILRPAADGSLHLPIPSELKGAGRLRVVAWLAPASAPPVKSGAGQWALQARGIAKLPPPIIRADARMDFLRHKFDLR